MVEHNQNNAKLPNFYSGVYLFADSDEKIRFISPGASAVLGFENEDILREKNLKTLIFSEPAQYDEFKNETEQNGTYGPAIVKCKDKKGYLLFLKLFLKKNQTQNTTCYEGIFQDVTAKIISGVSKNELIIGEQRLNHMGDAELVRLLIDSGDDVIYAKDAEGKYIFANKTFSELAGMSPQQIAGKTGTQILNFKNRQALEEFISLKYPYRKRAYISVILMNDTVQYFLPDVKQLKITGFDRPIVLITARNVTPIAKAEMALSKINDTLSEMVSKRTQQLEMSNINFSLLFEKGNEIKFLTRPNGKILKTNEKARETFGISETEMKDLYITDILEKDYYIQRPKITEAMEKYGNASFEGSLRTKDGKLLPVEVYSVKITYEDEPAYYATARDISHRKDAQRKILQAILKTEETERKRFAKELHDGLGALISAIKMYVDLLLEEKISKERIPEILKNTKDLIDEAAFSAREIANNIKPHILSNFGLTASLKEFLQKVKQTKDVSTHLFSKNFSGKLDDEIELTIYRIITELVNNTLKYAEADDLRISLRNTGNKLTVMYADNGKGFDLQTVLKSKDRGNGIRNLIARSENLNAKLRLAVVPTKGIFVRIKSDLTF